MRETIVDTEANEQLIGNSNDESRVEMQGNGFMIGGRRFLAENKLDASNLVDHSEFTPRRDSIPS